MRVSFVSGVAVLVALAALRVSGPSSAVVRAAGQTSVAAVSNHPILPDQFQTTWDPGIPGGIPSDGSASLWLPSGNPYNDFSVNPALTGPANAAAFTAALQNAINSAGAVATPTSRKIVKLKAGTYYVTQQPYMVDGVQTNGQVGIYVNVDNVTIRGEGPSTTRITAAGTIADLGTVILFGHRHGRRTDPDFELRNLRFDATRGSATVVVEPGAGNRYTRGDIVNIDRRDGPAGLAPSVTSLGAGPAMFNGFSENNDGYLWFYDAQYFKRQPADSWQGPGTGAPPVGRISRLSQANSYAQSAVPEWRSRSQSNEVVSVIGDTLTLKDPLHLDFPASDSQIWLMIGSQERSRAERFGNWYSGIEDIAVAGGNNSWGFPGGTVAFSYMAYGWAKNIEADGDKVTGDPEKPGKWGYNIGVGRSYRVVVRDSYAHGSGEITPGGHAYGIVVALGSSATLVENNISVNNNKPVVLIASGGGNVIAYNYVDRAIIWGRRGRTNGWQESALDDNHGAFTHNELIEGNWTPNIGGDSTHGNSGFITHLRNYAHGRNLWGEGANQNTNSNLRAVSMDAWTHDHAYIGNVLNMPVGPTEGGVYETTPLSKVGTPIYMLGNLAAGAGGNWDNGYAWSRIYRDANWDSFTNGYRLLPSSCAATASPCSIPESFYLSDRPAFFTSGYPWPWVNPLVGTTERLPAKARFDEYLRTSGSHHPNEPVPVP